MHRYFVVYKPYRMLSQFVSPYEHRLLGDLDYQFPEGTQAVGRLDDESEGLLILTTDKSLVKRLLHPHKNHVRHYLVQVEKTISDESIQKLRNGIEILVKKKGIYQTLPCSVTRAEAPDIFDRANDFKEYVPHSWLRFELTEGKNRQIRKMCKAVQHPCKRLIRVGIEALVIDGMVPGEIREINRKELFERLHLN